jgi:hypothetical protein
MNRIDQIKKGGVYTCVHPYLQYKRVEIKYIITIPVTYMKFKYFAYKVQSYNVNQLLAF